MFYPNEVVELKGKQFRVAAVNHQGKIILHPVYIKESTMDMMTRLQSTAPVEPEVLPPDPIPGL